MINNGNPIDVNVGSTIRGDATLLFAIISTPDNIASIEATKIDLPRIQYPANIAKKNIPHTIDAAPEVTVGEVPDINIPYGTRTNPAVWVMLTPLLIIVTSEEPKFVALSAVALGTVNDSGDASHPVESHATTV